MAVIRILIISMALYAAGLTAVAIVSAVVRHVQAQEAGSRVVSAAYCMTEEAARELAVAVAARNDRGYTEAMRRPDLKCYDARMHENIMPARVTLVSKVFSVVREDGKAFDFWLARDSGGAPGYVWTNAADDRV